MYAKRFLAIEVSTGIVGFWGPMVGTAGVGDGPVDALPKVSLSD